MGMHLDAPNFWMVVWEMIDPGSDGRRMGEASNTARKLARCEKQKKRRWSASGCECGIWDEGRLGIVEAIRVDLEIQRASKGRVEARQ